MSRELLRRAFLVFPLGLATLAGCRDTDTTAPMLESKPLFAQGDGGVWTVNSLADPGDGTCDDTNCTLREAIAAADHDHQIVFASSLQGSIALTAGKLVLPKDVSIDGGGRIAIDAQDASRVMELPTAAPSSGQTILDGLTFKGGDQAEVGGVVVGPNRTASIRNSSITENYTHTDGAGLYVESTASVTLLNSYVYENDANTTENGVGGGISNRGTLVIIGSTISNNHANQAGGIFNVSNATLSIVRSTISGNTASRTIGTVAGGILNRGTMNVVSTTIANNEDVGVVLEGIGSLASATAANTIIAGNECAPCAIISASGMISHGNNLTDETVTCNLLAPGDVHVVASKIFSHVLEQQLKDNGGPTMTHALIARGLAVDVGYCPGETADQRGFARPVDDPTMPNANDGCDIGAYEAQGPQVAVADLMVSQAVDKNSVKQGELLTYTVRVQNLGPQTAPDVVMNNVLSSGVTFVAARQNKGTIIAPPKGETGTVTWNLGDMVNQANEFAEIQVTVLVRGKTTITNTATVSGNVADPNPANNSAAITVAATHAVNRSRME